jgi:hypothetical protein
VFTFGEPGKSSVQIRVPIGFNIETLGDEMVSSVEAGENVYSATSIENPQDWYAFFTARNDEHLEVTPLTVGSAEFEIRSWPGDAEWTAYMSNIVTTGLPTLEGLIGQPWPHTAPFELVESLSPYLYGYAGWYDGAAEQIEVGEDLDDEVMLHELSHAWFNSDAFSERWLNEGLADTFAADAMIKLGKTPREPDPVTPTDAAAVRLAAWDEPFGTDEEIEALETFGYAASNLVVSQIVDDIGEDNMRLVLGAAQRGDIPYVGEGEPESVGESPDDWRRFLDLVEELGGATVAEPLLREWVILDDQIATLDQRAQARTAYDALETADGEWATPIGIRRSMTAWDFTRAEERIDSAQAVVDAHSDLLDTIKPLGLSITDEVEVAYEASLADQDEALGVISEFNDAAVVLLESDAAVTAERSFFERIGLRGKLPQDDHAAALAKFEAGDIVGTIASARIALNTYDDAESLGKHRATVAGGALGGFLALATLTGVGFRRRRRRRRITAAETLGATSVSAGSPASMTVTSNDVYQELSDVSAPASIDADNARNGTVEGLPTPGLGTPVAETATTSLWTAPAPAVPQPAWGSPSTPILDVPRPPADSPVAAPAGTDWRHAPPPLPMAPPANDHHAD